MVKVKLTEKSIHIGDIVYALIPSRNNSFDIVKFIVYRISIENDGSVLIFPSASCGYEFPFSVAAEDCFEFVNDAVDEIRKRSVKFGVYKV